MLSILNPRPAPVCNGFTRRDALKIGAMGAGLTLTDLLRAEANAGISSSKKAVIMVYMVGAPPHQDMYDLKMEAPTEIRGEFKPISTNVPGIKICEHLPRLAKIMDKLVPIRTVYGSNDGAHDSYICYTGRARRDAPQLQWPSVGSVVSNLQGDRVHGVPAFVGLAPKAGHPPYGSPGLPGFLGNQFSAFRASGPVGQDMVLKGITSDRLSHRKQLLQSLDQIKRDIDAHGMLDGMDAQQQQALEILTSSKLTKALDLSNEDPKVLDRYGKGDPKPHADGAPLNLQHFLLARRLVEAGARVVTLNFGRWDFHANNHKSLREKYLPLWDRGLSALIEDLHTRGMDQDVSVVTWGEFGRTPRINDQAGRDHWPQVGGALLAGGGMRTGQVIGSTDRIGGEPRDRPVHFGEVISSVYHCLGIPATQTTVNDLNQRPRYLVDGWEPMPELV